MQRPDRNNWLNLLRLDRTQRGQAITEYVLIIALIVIPLAVAVNQLAGVVKEFLARYSRMFWGPGI